jgi:hypothetical protein
MEEGGGLDGGKSLVLQHTIDIINFYIKEREWVKFTPTYEIDTCSTRRGVYYFFLDACKLL